MHMLSKGKRTNEVCRVASKRGEQLAMDVERQYGTNDVFEIAARAGLKVEYSRWPLITVGEFERRTSTITVNLAALEIQGKPIGQSPDQLARLIVAHELGHYFDERSTTKRNRGASGPWFMRDAGQKASAEHVAHSFATTLVRLTVGLEQVESLWRS
jgi:hypothetical protein